MRDTGSRAQRRRTNSARRRQATSSTTRSGRAISSAGEQPIAAAASKRASRSGPSTSASARKREASRTSSRRDFVCIAVRSASIGLGTGMALHGRELARLVIGDERVDELIERDAIEHRVELVQREIYAVL